MIPMRPVLVVLVVLSVSVALPVTVVWPAGEPRLEVVSGEPDASLAYTHFSHHLKMNIHALWQREGQRQVSLTQRWRVGVSEIGRGRERGIEVWVRKAGVPPVFSGSEWASERVFLLYPLSDHLVEPSAAVAAAAVVEFLKGRVLGAAAGGEQKR